MGMEVGKFRRRQEFTPAGNVLSRCKFQRAGGVCGQCLSWKRDEVAGKPHPLDDCCLRRQVFDDVVLGVHFAQPAPELGGILLSKFCQGRNTGRMQQTDVGVGQSGNRGPWSFRKFWEGIHEQVPPRAL